MGGDSAGFGYSREPDPASLEAMQGAPNNQLENSRSDTQSIKFRYFARADQTLTPAPVPGRPNLPDAAGSG